MKSQSYLKTASIVGLMLSIVTGGSALAALSPQLPLAAKAIPQFVQPLPTLSQQPGVGMQTVLGNQPVTLRMCEFKANVLPAAAVVGYTGTWVWGYLPDPLGTSTCSSSSLPTRIWNNGSDCGEAIAPIFAVDECQRLPLQPGGIGGLFEPAIVHGDSVVHLVFCQNSSIGRKDSTVGR